VAKRRPCRICGGWFHPDPRVGSRQRACGKRACQKKRREKTQAAWRSENPEYFLRRRLQRRATAARAAEEAVEDPQLLRALEAEGEVRRPGPLRLPKVLARIPWDLAQDEIGVAATDFLAVTARLLVKVAQDQITGNSLC
jgi:hypothetical protein